MNIFTADIGSGKVHFYDLELDKIYLKHPQKDLIELRIPGIKNGDTVVIEETHLREKVQGGLSMAHAFSMEDLYELERNAKKRDIKIRLFPQKKTPTVRKLAGYDPEHNKSNKIFMRVYGMSTDEADIRSIAKFILRDPEAFKRFKKFKPISQKEYQKQNQHKFDFIQECNKDLNIARTEGYGFDNYYEYGDNDAVTQFIKNNLHEIASRLNVGGIFDSGNSGKFSGEELLSSVGLEYSKSKSGVLNKLKSENRLYTIVCSILRPNGELRTRKFPPIDEKTGKPHKYYSEDEHGNYTGKELPVLWKFVKANYFGCQTFHEHQGVAASNYKQHTRPSISNFKKYGKSLPISASQEIYEEFKKGRNRSDQIYQEIWHILRKMIVEDGLR